MYTSITDKEKKEMLGVIGAASVEELFADIPESIAMKGSLDLPGSLSEMELEAHVGALGSMNRQVAGFIGAGAYDHYIPAAVDQLSGRSEFYTSYTPYQAEVSQGTLIAIFEYQTLVARLTGMDIANASLYDGATAVAESVLMSMRANGRKKVVVSGALHPNYRSVMKTYSWASDRLYHEVPHRAGVTDADLLRESIDDSVACVVVQNPNFFGSLEDIEAIAAAAHSAGAHCIVCVAEPLSLGILKNPGEMGADIVCGEGQGFGNPVGFGGPMLGMLAARKEFMRRIPGRLVGRTLDADGKTAYVLTLQAREQHIRRDRATSNICTNQGLCALRAVIYLCIVGNRLRELARLNHARASYLRRRLLDVGFRKMSDAPYFNEFTVAHERAVSIRKGLLEQGFSFGLPLGDYYPGMEDSLLVCVTEKNTVEQIDLLVSKIQDLVRG